MMLLRIVHMEFREEKILEFQKLFRISKVKFLTFKIVNLFIYKEVNSMFSIRTAIGYR